MDISAVLTLALSDYHWLRRPLHGLLHRSCIAVVYPTLELICEFWPSKFSHYPSRPATRSFYHYPTRSRPEVKNHYPSVSGCMRGNSASTADCTCLLHCCTTQNPFMSPPMICGKVKFYQKKILLKFECVSASFSHCSEVGAI